MEFKINSAPAGMFEETESVVKLDDINSMMDELNRLENLGLAIVIDSQFEKYAEFCIECDRKGLKAIKYRDYLKIG